MKASFPIRLLLISTAFLFSGSCLFAQNPPPGCEANKECMIESPETTCGDGTKSFFTVTSRPESKSLMIFLQGGGACWDFLSCTGGFAKSLTRILPHNDWIGGKGIFNGKSELNPFRKDTVVTVPYCTGDVFGGSRDVEYSDGRQTKKVRHQGYRNVTMILDQVKRLYPNPERITLIGESAGGLGVLFHLKNVVRRFPGIPVQVLSDGGVPFKPPYIKEASYRRIMENWGAVLEGKATNFAELIEENIKKNPDVKFGLIASYFDYVMTFFATSVGSPSALKAVKNTLVEVSDKYIGLNQANQKVFYFDSTKHLHLSDDFGGVESIGKSFAAWLGGVLGVNEATWENVRPDLHRDLTADVELDAMMKSQFVAP